MKKMLALLLAVMMLCSAAAMTASAETEVTYVETSFYYPTLNEANNTIYAKPDRSQGYALYDAYGYAITEPIYANIRENDYGFRITVGEGTNNNGFINDMGQVLVPAQYGDVDCYSVKWQVGVALKEATSDNFDYQTYGSEKTFFLIDHADVYYCGTMIGTLNRNQYTSNTYAYGEYLHVRDRDGNYHYYNKNFVESGATGSSPYSEYMQEFRNGKYYYTHCGSGQPAFVAGCTLTADEVVQSVMKEGGKLIDLQGNIIADLPYSWIYNFDNGYARVESKDDKFGLINEKGEEIIACLYDELDYSGPACGYISAVKDGKQGFVSLADGSETGFVYPSSAVNVEGAFAKVKDLDGTYIIITAKAGVLPDHYQDCSFEYSDHCPLAVLQNMDGACGVIGLGGEIVIPFSEEYDDTYDLDLSDDGTVILDTYGKIYQVDYDFGQPAVTAPSAPTADVEPETPAAAGWFCPTCGNENPEDSNFCPKDGTRKPETEWTCPTCGNVNPADSNFCPKDGTKKP